LEIEKEVCSLSSAKVKTTRLYGRERRSIRDDFNSSNTKVSTFVGNED